MLAYKVVSHTVGVNPERYFSVVTNGKYSIEYKIGEAAKPIIGKILVFENLQLARAFCECSIDSIKNKMIFECEVDSLTQCHILCYHDSNFDAFWCNPLTLKPRWNVFEAPFGTCLCNWCKLIKQLPLESQL